MSDVEGMFLQCAMTVLLRTVYWTLLQFSFSRSQLCQLSTVETELCDLATWNTCKTTNFMLRYCYLLIMSLLVLADEIQPESSSSGQKSGHYKLGRNISLTYLGNQLSETGLWLQRAGKRLRYWPQSLNF